ncbi:tryptophanyl-tRNA synthetase [Halanaerobium saccharolyticum]|uniref:Tryptophan--tRNA ligase n=1 Tax=Halanaerobium saccharolyticum TaxID=43595 RepID=A0A4R7YWP4_9FIRM|nr:tryptophan--tRNA ligase [Halanaerobium saccharolyticum]RAK10253.1 tryptophanyl-tRNA synthetase [Halanaerobium saccharolyticum]TDW00465.1 tryptophanyl-tRNA synthetase [Halanaerobium saccharolyticum]TDX52050.1 tryptophanyl-tRNA synthetase [Halanaerobium saccharolyticum]
MENKKRVFSGVQPTGQMHIGNYVGALSLWVENQKKYDNIFCIVDLHALTIPESIKPEYLRKKVKEVAALYLACGIDPEESTIFVQSDVPEHSELTWLLNCVTPVGWLERMTQFKSKSKKLESVGTGLFDYPVLMASDILLYNTDLVPVGEDQKQHIEITRDIAQRFNHLYGNVLKVPEELIRKSGARIMGFDDPEAKMSKSTGESKKRHAIGLLDSPEVIKETIMSATTDSNRETRFDYASPGIKNMLTLYQALTNQTQAEIENHFSDGKYGKLKKELAEVVIEILKPIQQKYKRIINEETYLNNVLKEGEEKAGGIAAKTMDEVKTSMGLK